MLRGNPFGEHRQECQCHVAPGVPKQRYDYAGDKWSNQAPAIRGMGIASIPMSA